MTLGELGAVRAQDHRHVGERGGLVAQRLVEQEVARRAGKPLLGTHDVADAHLVVVDHVGQMVGGEAVRLEDNEVVDDGQFNGNLAANEVMGW